ncbi:MAG TPA: heavy metal-associated domain-containing protein, partial [Pirellulales bacterium]|nr:heavy metal-associated domain-containing protein [Pirellulales bacterium]
MKPSTAIVATIVFSVIAVANSARSSTGAETKQTFLIRGLHCPPCTRTVEASLARVKGVQSVKVDWTSKNARVAFDESVISAQQVAQVIATTPHMMGGGMHYKGSLALKVPGLDDAKGKAAKEALAKVP